MERLEPVLQRVAAHDPIAKVEGLPFLANELCRERISAPPLS